MSTLAEKMDKQFEYQRTRHATSGDSGHLLVSVDHLAAYLAEQTRRERGEVRRRVKAELERRADAGQLRRWTGVHGPSVRPVRADHYLLPPAPAGA